MDEFEAGLKGMERGTTPWPVEEAREAFGWYHSLHETPKDDWSDLKDKSINIVSEDGEQVSQLGFNAMEPMNQLGFFMVGKYGGNPVAAHHISRLMRIVTFIQDRRQQMFDDGWSRKGETADYDEINPHFFEALCTLPYSKLDPVVQRWVFDYDEVAGHALMLQVREEQSEE